jgi:hypothetical protein
MKQLILSLVFVAASLFTKAQSPSNIVTGSWQNAILRADGRTIVDDVEAYCMKTTCNGEDFITIKFKNNNNYQVAVEWVDAIYLNNVWNYPQSQTPKKVYVPANSDFAGSCGGEIKLKLQINSIVAVPDGSGHYTVSGLTVSQ